MQLSGKVFDFLGDSITEGCRVSASDKVFHQLIARQHGMQWCYNYGVGGTRIARQVVPSKENTHRDLTFELRAEIMDRRADAVVFGGTNDFGIGDAPFGTLDSEDVYTFCGAVNSLINKLSTNFPDADIVFMTPLHRLGETSPHRTAARRWRNTPSRSARYVKNAAFPSSTCLPSTRWMRRMSRCCRTVCIPMMPDTSLWRR